jgi:hypothetical protein
MINECRRMEESCLYTSTTLFEWLKCLRFWRAFFVVIPIIWGGLAPWPLLAKHDGYKRVTGVCALLAGFAPAIYKALNFDVSLNGIAQHAQLSKTLQDRFRQAWRVTALGPFEDFKKEFDDLMAQKDAARASSLSAPERFFLKALKKIEAGHYSFSVDEKTADGQNVRDQGDFR